MRKTVNAGVVSMTGLIVVIGWALLVVIFRVALPPAWQTQTMSLSGLALGLAWLVLVLAIAPFFASKYGVGESAPMHAMRLGIAIIYVLAVIIVTLRFAWPVGVFAYRFLLGIHAILLGVLLVGMLVASLIHLKAIQVGSEEDFLREGLSEITCLLAEIDLDTSSMGDGLDEIKRGIGRISDTLRYTSPSDKPEASASEVRLLSGVQRLKDSLTFQKSLQNSAQSSMAQQDEMKRVIVELEKEALYRSRITV